METEKMDILVIGGGPVAHRKCLYFPSARITVISRSVIPEIGELASEVIISDSVAEMERLMDGRDLIIAATDDKAVNSHIVKAARSLNIPVNSAHGGGTVLIPSVLRRPGYSVAVSSLGSAPAFPPYLVEELNGMLGKRYDLMLDLLAEARKTAAESISDGRERREFILGISTDPDIRALIESEDYDSALKIVKQRAVK
jgi:siroheme synthase-like protein